MSMGNYLRVQSERQSVMAATNQTVGFDHVTVVPENFEPDEHAQTDEGESGRTDRE
jgi:hypothetical protein